MKKCFILIVIIYILYVWTPPFLTILFPINKADIEGNYILSSCKIEECAFYNIHFMKNMKVITQCIDIKGHIKNSSTNIWTIQNGHKIVLADDFDDFYFPRFGDVHRNMFFPWVIKLETSINGKCEFDQWNFANKL